MPMHFDRTAEIKFGVRPNFGLKLWSKW